MAESQERNISDQEEWATLKREREEYLEKLRKWLNEARLSHYNSGSASPFNNVNTGENITDPQHLQQQHILNLNATLAQVNLWNESLQNVLRQRFPSQTAVNRNGVHHHHHHNHHHHRHTSNFTSQTNQRRPRTYEFVIPPLWKRMLAELMDFLILFIVKMALTFIMLESFDIMDVFRDMEFYGFESFQKNLENPDVAMPMAIEWLTLEFLHRLIVCAYETYFLKGKCFATPGKRYMGLMVITVDNVSPVPGRITETVSATGAAPLGWHKSMTRATMKNLFVGLLLPLCVAFYIFPHNRTSYDMMSNSIVVEYHQEFMAYHSRM